MICHVVLMRFTEPEDAGEAKARLESLPEQIPSLLSLVVGLDVLRTDASYDLSLVSTHDDLDGLRAYQDHPAHQEFGRWLSPRLSSRAVVDSTT